MKTELFLHLLDIAYPNGQLPVEKEKLESLIKRFDKTISELQLDNDGKLIGGGNFLCDVSKGGKDIIDLSLNEIDQLDETITLTIGNPQTRWLLHLIRELNERDWMVTGVSEGVHLTYIEFRLTDY